MHVYGFCWWLLRLRLARLHCQAFAYTNGIGRIDSMISGILPIGSHWTAANSTKQTTSTNSTQLSLYFIRPLHTTMFLVSVCVCSVVTFRLCDANKKHREEDKTQREGLLCNAAIHSAPYIVYMYNGSARLCEQSLS